ncbi:Beige/BEACH domain-containing protein, partial [Helicosporidium sp. ATCC 50920]
ARGGLLEGSLRSLRRVRRAWQRGRLSNFDYLLYCNLAAGRTFCDLAQWPVFPWVLARYEGEEEVDLDGAAGFRDLCRPMGALDEARLARFRSRLRDMESLQGEPGTPKPFLYGSHYSCPAYVSHWLLRAAPALGLRLQGGRFDAPDRLFCSVAGAWRSALSSSSDVRELVPEMFLGDPAFLTNAQRLPLGTRHSGEVVGDVELPPWARGDPLRFLACQRAALEAPYVSANLHHWIDLLFGCKQRGEAAKRADNLFRDTTYALTETRRRRERRRRDGRGAGEAGLKNDASADSKKDASADSEEDACSSESASAPSSDASGHSSDSAASSSGISESSSEAEADPSG